MDDTLKKMFSDLGVIEWQLWHYSSFRSMTAGQTVAMSSTTPKIFEGFNHAMPFMIEQDRMLIIEQIRLGHDKTITEPGPKFQLISDPLETPSTIHLTLNSHRQSEFNFKQPLIIRGRRSVNFNIVNIASVTVEIYFRVSGYLVRVERGKGPDGQGFNSL